MPAGSDPLVTVYFKTSLYGSVALTVVDSDNVGLPTVTVPNEPAAVTQVGVVPVLALKLLDNVVVPTSTPQHTAFTSAASDFTTR